MSESFSLHRTAHPAVSIRSADWPIWPEAGLSTIAEFSTSETELKFALNQVVIDSSEIDLQSEIYRQLLLLEKHIPELNIVGLTEIGWNLRDLITTDTAHNRAHTRKQKVEFELPPKSIGTVRAGMLTVIMNKGDFEDPTAVISSLTDEDIREFAFSKIDNMFYSLADIYNIIGPETPLVATEGGFEPAFVSALLGRFEIPHTESKYFTDSVYRSVLNFLRMGGVFAGSWGNVAFRGQNLYLVLSPPKKSVYTDSGEVELSFE